MWDTLVTRRLNEPSDIFLFVENISGVKNFSKVRQIVEFNLRKTQSEITLEQIYSELQAQQVTWDCSSLKQLEVDLEVAFSSRIETNAQEVKTDDMILTDMYLPRDTLSKILIANNIKIPDTNLIISSEIGKTKSSGDLYRTLPQNHKINKHIGDNYHSDVTMAQRTGLKAFHYNDSIRRTKIEQKFSEIETLQSKLLVGALRAGRLKRPGSKDNRIEIIEWEIYSQIVSPIIVSFCEKILTDMVSKGIKNAYFLARDGQILKKVCEKIVKARGYDITCSYFLASRQALHLPGYVTLDENALSWIFEDEEKLTWNILALRLELSDEQLKSLKDEFAPKSLQEGLIGTSICANLKTSNKFNEIIRANSELRLIHAKGYFEKMGVITENQSKNIAIVDVGWRCRLQKSFENIIEKITRQKPTVFGYYIGVKDADRSHINSSFGYLYKETSGQNLVTRAWIDKYANMFEYFLHATHSQVIKYDGSDVGVKFAQQFGTQERRRFERRHLAIMSFCQSYCDQLEIKNDLSLFNEELLISNLNQFFTRPSLEQAQVFCDSDHTSEQSGVRKEKLITPLTLKSIVFERTLDRGFWPEAGARVSNLLWLYYVRRKIQDFVKNVLLGIQR